jgi:hypothetical protein
VCIIDVRLDLPFYLRLKDHTTVRYEEVCHESQIDQLLGREVVISFSPRRAGEIDKSDVPKVQTTIAIKVVAPVQLSEGDVNKFAIKNCLEIINRLVTAYQAATREMSNAGYIVPLGMSYMQLFAHIQINGNDFRDRWPSHNIDTFPLPDDTLADFNRFVTGQGRLPLADVFLSNAALSLNLGQYPLAVLQAATAVELRTTQIIREKLEGNGWSDQAIKPYERMTLGQKLQLPKTDPRSLQTYYDGIAGFDNVFNKAKDELTRLRNQVAHRGHLPSFEETSKAVGVAQGFIEIVI